MFILKTNKHIMRLFFFSFILFAFINCSDTEPLIDGPGGAAHYYINNVSDIDVAIIFIKSEELGLETSDSQTIASNSAVKIFEDGKIGSNPQPENSFSEISFYNSPENGDAPLFKITTVINENWTIIDQDLGDSGYGLTSYQFTITNDHLN